MKQTPLLSKRVAVFVASEFYRHRNQSPFWDLLLAKLREETAIRGWHMTLHFSGGREGTYFLESAPTKSYHPNTVSDSEFIGVLALGMQSKSVEWMLKQGISVATFAGSGSPIGVEMDQFEFIRLGVQEMARAGVKYPAFFKPLTALRPFCLDAWAYRMAERVESTWKEALNENGLEFRPEFFRNLTAECLAKCDTHPPVVRYQDQGAQIAQEMFSHSDIPDGFLSVDDTFTQGTLMALRQQFPHILANLVITTQSNEGSPILWCEENLIRLQVSPAEIAWHLCECLEISNAYDGAESERILLSPSVVLPTSMLSATESSLSLL
jgi:DNA-binding LacI/PurR family transcriptional regulator